MKFLEAESLSPFLGRARRVHELTPPGLDRAAGIVAVVAQWEKFRYSRQQLEAMASPQPRAYALVVGVEADRWVQILPPSGVGMKLEAIRLCGACYVDRTYAHLARNRVSLDISH